MNKIVSASEFKARCLKLIAEMEKDGESVVITKHGKTVAELRPKKSEGEKSQSLLGMLKGVITLAPDFQPEESGLDPDWEEQWLAKWDERMRVNK